MSMEFVFLNHELCAFTVLHYFPMLTGNWTTHLRWQKEFRRNSPCVLFSVVNFPVSPGNRVLIKIACLFNLRSASMGKRKTGPS